MQHTTTTLQQHIPLVHKVAKRIARRLPHVVQLDELVSAGTLGLIDALTRFDPTRAQWFAQYAEIRIRGAILDELRHMDWLPRAERARVRRGEQAETLHAVVSIDDVREDGFDSVGSADDLSPSAGLEHSAKKQRLAAAIAALPHKQQQVLSLYYVEELTLKQIGELLGVTESRICQIHRAAVAALREEMLDDVEL
jgi:RNA polymerase sigma factor for flagellar operon FliA